MKNRKTENPTCCKLPPVSDHNRGDWTDKNRGLLTCLKTKSKWRWWHQRDFVLIPVGSSTLQRQAQQKKLAPVPLLARTTNTLACSLARVAVAAQLPKQTPVAASAAARPNHRWTCMCLCTDSFIRLQFSGWIIRRTGNPIAWTTMRCDATPQVKWKGACMANGLVNAEWGSCLKKRNGGWWLGVGDQMIAVE